MKKLLWISAFSYLATGFSHVMIGSVLTEILDHYGGNYSDGGRLVFAQFFGFLLGVSLVAILVRRFGRRRLLVVAFSVMTLTQCYAVFLPAWGLLIAITFIMGIAFGIIESSIGALVLLAFQDKQAAAMGKLELYFGLGALLMPFFCGIFLYFELWRYAFLPLGGVALLLALCWQTMDFGAVSNEMLGKPMVPNEPKDGNQKEKDMSGVMDRKRGLLFIFAGFFFLYVGLEVCLIEFAPSWMKEDYGLDSASSVWIVTIFWATMSLGRAMIGYMAARLSYFHYLLWSISGALASVIGLALSPVAWMAYVFMAILGLSMAGIFAVALIYANLLISGREQSTTSFVIAFGGIGGATMPLALGSWMDRFGTASSIWLLAAVVLLLLVIMTVVPSPVSSSETTG